MNEPILNLISCQETELIVYSPQLSHLWNVYQNTHGGNGTKLVVEIEGGGGYKYMAWHLSTCLKIWMKQILNSAWWFGFPDCLLRAIGVANLWWRNLKGIAKWRNLHVKSCMQLMNQRHELGIDGGGGRVAEIIKNHAAFISVGKNTHLPSAYIYITYHRLAYAS